MIEATGYPFEFSMKINRSKSERQLENWDGFLYKAGVIPIFDRDPI
jgi:hypothetical protein